MSDQATSSQSTGAIAFLKIEGIRYRSDARQRTDEALAQLADSIQQVGLINPIRVRRISDGYEVVAGAHRLQACDSLDWHEVPCIIVDEDDLHAELAMIDENLVRAELSASERASQTARRKAIYLELHPDTAPVTERGGPGRGKTTDNLSTVSSFASETAAATGKDERTVRRDAERGEKVIPEAMRMVIGTRLDTGSYLDKIKKLPPNEQVQAVKRDLAQPAAPKSASGGIARRYAPTGKSAKPIARPFDRFVNLVNDIEAIGIDELMTDVDRRRRAELGQRASGLADRMGEVMERLER